MSEPTAVPERPRCKTPGCPRPQRCRGYCGKHYQAARANGELETGTRKARTTPAPKNVRASMAEIMSAAKRPTTTATGPRFVVRLGELVVECRELGDVVELHRALGGPR